MKNKCGGRMLSDSKAYKAVIFKRYGICIERETKYINRTERKSRNRSTYIWPSTEVQSQFNEKKNNLCNILYRNNRFPFVKQTFPSQ